MRNFNKLTKLGMLFLLAVTLCSCAFGRRINYRGHSGFVPEVPDTKYTIAVVDKRPYVLSGSKQPSFVGLQRSLYGIPYNVKTQSGAPLSNDLAEMIASTFSYNGKSAQSVTVPPGASIDDFVSSWEEGFPEGEVGLLFVLKEWKTDRHFREIFRHNAELSVISRDSGVLASVSDSGTKTLSRSYPLNQAITELFGGMLNSSEISSVLPGFRGAVSKASPKDIEVKSEASQSALSDEQLVETLKKLKSAFEDGILTESEYNAKKSQLIRRY